MNKNYMYSLTLVIVLFLIAYVGTQGLGLQFLFGVVLPYFAFLVFIVGVTQRIMGWANSPVPFRITTTCGQQRSLSWIKSSVIENPSTKLAVLVRMILEVFCFRSLFRNTRMKLESGKNSKLTYKLEFFLWFGAIVFHYSFLVVVLRHLRFFIEPVPFFVTFLERLDSFFRIEILYDLFHFGLPGVFLSGFVLLGALFYLFTRRILIPKIKYISLASDFFPLFLIMGIVISGIFMRYFTKIDIIHAKEIAMGLVTLRPVVFKEIDGLFYAHIFLVSILMMYFPFSKLMHSGGILLSPTRNMTGNSREVRHVNPWNYPVKVHTYEEYENDFREKMINAGVPVDKAHKKHSGGKE